MGHENFTDNLATLSRELLHKLSGIPKNDIRNVKHERGMFPNRIISVVDAGGETRQKQVPYSTGDLFIAFGLEDDPDNIKISERISNTIVAQYNFSVVFVIYGTESSFIANKMLLNRYDSGVLDWLGEVGLGYSEIEPQMETQDTMINNQWWIIRRGVFKLNCGVAIDSVTQDIRVLGITLEAIRNLERT